MRKASSLLWLFLVWMPAMAQPVSDQERNKQIAQSFFEEVLGQGRLDKYAESHAKDFVAHGENHEYTLEEDMAAAREERKALPDMRVRVNEILAERDRVMVYWTASGTNTQAGMGFPGTGKKIKIDDHIPFQRGEDFRGVERLGHAFSHATGGFNLFAAVTGRGGGGRRILGGGGEIFVFGEGK